MMLGNFWGKSGVCLLNYCYRLPSATRRVICFEKSFTGFPSTASKGLCGARRPVANCSAIGQIGMPSARSFMIHCPTYARAQRADFLRNLKIIPRERPMCIGLCLVLLDVARLVMSGRVTMQHDVRALVGEHRKVAAA